MYLYGGISGSTLPVEQFELGYGLSLHRTYAHLTSPCLMAFAPASPEKPHPAPWRPAKGGFSYDITIELRVPDTPVPGGFAATEAMWWIVALLRLSYAPYLTIPVTIDMPFADAARSKVEPTITPFEVESRFFFAPKEQETSLTLDDLHWLKENWVRAANLMQRHPKIFTALQACDACRVRTRLSSALLSVWGALEQLFAPSAGELRYRVAANLAAYLEPRGPKRLAAYKHVLQLYNKRSTAAHTAAESDLGTLLESWVLLRNALMKMIGENHVPTQADFERILFVDSSIDGPKAIPWSGQKIQADSV